MCLKAAAKPVTASAEHSVDTLISSVCKADNSHRDWRSALATAAVRLISLSVSSLRVLCLIAATKLITALEEHSAKPYIFSACRADNLGSDWLSASAAADVKWILLSFSFLRGLCFITSINLVTASAEHSVQPLISSSDNGHETELLKIHNCKLHPFTPPILKLFKADNSGSDWRSTSATADVKFTLLTFSFSRVLSLIAATNFVTDTSEHSVKLLISSVRKTDSSGSDRLSASATADVMSVSLSVRFFRVLCLIAATNFVTASSEHSAKRRSRWMMFSNLGNKCESSAAPFDDKQQNRIDKEHLR